MSPNNTSNPFLFFCHKEEEILYLFQGGKYSNKGLILKLNYALIHFQSWLILHIFGFLKMPLYFKHFLLTIREKLSVNIQTGPSNYSI